MTMWKIINVYCHHGYDIRDGDEYPRECVQCVDAIQMVEMERHLEGREV